MNELEECKRRQAEILKKERLTKEDRIELITLAELIDKLTIKE